MVIDLDVPRVTGTPRGRRWPARRAARPVAVAAVLLTVLSLGGSATPAAGLRRVLVTEGTTGVFALAPSAVFAAEAGPTAAASSVRRYPLPGGSAPWVARLPHRVDDLDLAAPAKVLVATSANNTQTTFLDSDTGRVLWRAITTEIALVRLAATSALVFSSAAGAPVLRRVDLRTGAVLWSRPFDPTGYVDAGDPTLGDLSRIVTVDQRGVATTRAFADGRVLATADLGAAPTPNDDGLTDVARFDTFGDRLYLARRDGGAESLTAFRLDDLRQLWRSTVVPVGTLTWCGADVCVTTVSGMTVIDGADGSPRWSDPRWRLGYDTRAAGMPGPPRLAVMDDQPDPERALLDPATGRVLALLGRSTRVGPVMLRPDAARAGRIWVQAPGPGRDVRTLGHLDRVAPRGCAATAEHLACVGPTGPVTVWTMPD